jgi:hypothetical protein
MKFPAKQLLAVAAVFGSGLGVSLGAAAATLNIIGCDSFSGDPTTGTITCVTGSTTPPSPPAGAPSGCTASVSPTSLPAIGGAVNLATASCTSGGTPDDSKTKLKRNGVVVSRPDTLPSNSTSSASARYSYTAQFCTSDGTCGADVAAGTVTVAAGVTTPPPSTGSCGNLKVINQFIAELRGGTSDPLTFDQTRYITSGFDGSSVVVATIKVPAGVIGSTSVEVREYGAQATGRRVWLSKTMCDFTATGRYYQAAPQVKLPIWIGASNPDPAYYAWVQPGETWYVMVKNESFGYFGVTNTCKSGGCEASVKAGNIQP